MQDTSNINYICCCEVDGFATRILFDSDDHSVNLIFHSTITHGDDSNGNTTDFPDDMTVDIIIPTAYALQLIRHMFRRLINSLQEKIRYFPLNIKYSFHYRTLDFRKRHRSSPCVTLPLIIIDEVLNAVSNIWLHLL